VNKYKHIYLLHLILQIL